MSSIFPYNLQKIRGTKGFIRKISRNPMVLKEKIIAPLPSSSIFLPLMGENKKRGDKIDSPSSYSSPLERDETLWKMGAAADIVTHPVNFIDTPLFRGDFPVLLHRSIQFCEWLYQMGLEIGFSFR